MTEPRKPMTNAELAKCKVCSAVATHQRRNPDGLRKVEDYCARHKPDDVRIEREGDGK